MFVCCWSCATAAARDTQRHIVTGRAAIAIYNITSTLMDALRDDSRIWIKVLSEAGVKVKANLYVPLSTAAACGIRARH